MTETPQNTTKKPNSFWIDFGPLLVFFGAFQYFKRSNPDEAMLWAAGVFAVCAVIALAFGWVKHRTVSKMLIFSTFIIVVTAALALMSGDKRIFFMKPTVINIRCQMGHIGHSVGVILFRNGSPKRSDLAHTN